MIDRKKPGLPPLTTRMSDAFTQLEIRFLRVANRYGVVWVRLGVDNASKDLEAAHNLQRWGYLWPTTEDMPDFGGDARAVGWVITDEGRGAFHRISSSEAA